MLETGIRGIENRKPPAHGAPGAWGVGMSAAGILLGGSVPENQASRLLPYLHDAALVTAENALVAVEAEPSCGSAAGAKKSVDVFLVVFHGLVVCGLPKRGRVSVWLGLGFGESGVIVSRGRAGVSGPVPAGPRRVRHGLKSPLSCASAWRAWNARAGFFVAECGVWCVGFMLGKEKGARGNP